MLEERENFGRRRHGNSVSDSAVGEYREFGVNSAREFVSVNELRETLVNWGLNINRKQAARLYRHYGDDKNELLDSYEVVRERLRKRGRDSHNVELVINEMLMGPKPKR